MGCMITDITRKGTATPKAARLLSALYDGRTKSTYEPKRKVRYGLKKLVNFHIRKNKSYTKLTG
jgi:hypothetical protein